MSTQLGQDMFYHYSDVIMGTVASQITSLTIVYSTVYSGKDQRKHQSSASLAFVRGIHWGPVNSPHKRPVTWKMFPFDDVIMFFNNWSPETHRTHQWKDQSHKSHNQPLPYHTMHHSEQKCVHFCSEWCIVGYGRVHCGICEWVQLGYHYFK